MRKQETVLEKEIHKILLNFEIQSDHIIPARRTASELINKIKRIYRLVDLAVSVDDWMKIKQNEKRDKYLDLDWEGKKLANMRVRLIPIVDHGLEKVLSSLEKRLKELEIGGRIETI